MNKQEAFATIGITQEEFNIIIKVREPLKKGNSCEIKATKDGDFTIYEVNKRKK
jgi:hypothetical protein